MYRERKGDQRINKEKEGKRNQKITNNDDAP
jgi:hypothetical protein